MGRFLWKSLLWIWLDVVVGDVWVVFDLMFFNIFASCSVPYFNFFKYLLGMAQLWLLKPSSYDPKPIGMW